MNAGGVTLVVFVAGVALGAIMVYLVERLWRSRIRRSRISKIVLGPLSDDAAAARRPLPPDSLGRALHDRVHTDVGRARPAKVSRRSRT